MNFTKFLLIFSLISVFSACTKDEDEPLKTDETGMWELIGLEYSGTNTTTSPFGDFVTEFIGVGSSFDATATFENGNFTTEGSYSVELTSTTDGQTTVQNVPVNQNQAVGAYSISGSNITVTQPDDGTQNEGEIIELTGTSFIFTLDIETSMDLGGGTIQTSIINTEYRLRR